MFLKGPKLHSMELTAVCILMNYNFINTKKNWGGGGGGGNISYGGGGEIYPSLIISHLPLRIKL